MEFFELLRPLADPRLLIENGLLWAICAGVIGALAGLKLAHHYWYRSARRIEELEAERVALREGDIDVDRVDTTTPARDTRIGVGEVATVGGAAAVAATTVNKEPEPIGATPPPLTKDDEPHFSTVYAERPHDADDLTLLEGIDEAKAAELNRAGIYKYSQLSELDEEERRKFGSKFTWPDINWGAWGATAAAVGGATLLKGNNDEKPTEVVSSSAPQPPSLDPDYHQDSDLNLGTVYTERPVDADDLTILEGIDSEKAEELNRAGIYKFSQLEEMDEEQRTKLGNKFSWPDLDWGKWALGTGAAAVGGAALLNRDKEEEVEPVADISAPQPINLPEPITPPVPSSEASDANVNPDWTWGYTYTEKPDNADDLTQLDGISEEDAARLNAEGVYTFQQLQDLPEDKREEVQSKFGWSDINWGKWGTAGAVGVAGTAGAIALGGNDEDEETTYITPPPAPSIDLASRQDTEPDSEWGWRFNERPDDADDLTEMGISQEDAEELNRQGVYTFKQLEDLPEEKKAEVQSNFGWGDINWGKWGTIGAAGAAGTAGAIALGRDDEEETKSYTFSSLEDREDTEPDSTWGWRFNERPDDADDLTEMGISQEDADELNRQGVYTFKQLEDLPEDKKAEVQSNFGWGDINWGKWGTIGAVGAAGTAGAIALGRDEEEETKSYTFSSLEDREDTEPDSTWGWRFNERPDDADDLTEMGISQEDAEELNRQGVYTFKQLEDLPEEKKAEVQSNFGWGDINWGKWGTIGAAGAAGTAGAIALGRDDKDTSDGYTFSTLEEREDTEPDSTWGWRFNERPDDADDLTEMGISQEDADELNRQGVYTFKQMEDLPEDKKEEVKSKFGWGDVNWGKWGTIGAVGVAGTAGAIALGKDDDDSSSSLGGIAPPSLGGSDTMGYTDETQAITPPAVDSVDQSDWNWGYSFKDNAPVEVDDLTQIEGVTQEDAIELNRHGIYNFKQIEEMPEEHKEELQSRFGNINWAKWGTVGAIGAAGTAAAVTFGKDSEETADTLSVWEEESDRISKTSAPVIDTTSKYGELNLSQEDFKTSLEEDFAGEEVDIHPRYGIIYPGHPQQIDDLTRVRGIGLATEKELNQNGIYRFKQVASWNAAAVEGISTDMNLGTRVRDDEWISQAKVLAEDSTGGFIEDSTDYDSLIGSQYAGEDVEYKPGLGVLYNTPPAVADDLTEIKGIGNSLQSKLNDYGVYRFRQIADWNEVNVESFNDRMGFVGRIERDEWLPQAERMAQRAEEEANYVDQDADLPLPETSDYNAVLDLYAGENVSVDQARGVIYNERPDQADDLKQIFGVGSRIESELNDNGIYKFSQIANWNDYNVREFNDRLAFKGRIQRDEWIYQARQLDEESSTLSGQYQPLISSQFYGEPVTVKPGYGVVYTRQPDAVDDLTEINGIGPATERQLNDNGIYTFKQIANLDDINITTIENDIDGPGRVTRDRWIEQAQDFVGTDHSAYAESEPAKPGMMDYLEVLDSFDGENVDIDENFGVVYSGRPSEQDDLKRIRGVGKSIESELNSRGIYRYKQVANWNDYNVWSLGRDMQFPGRITREGWVDQAKSLTELDDYRRDSEQLLKTKYAGQNVRVDPDLGVVYNKRPDIADDLTQLDGIDAATEAKLNEDGIYTIDQIKTLKGAQQQNFASRFGLSNIDWGRWGTLGAAGIGAAGISSVAKGADMVKESISLPEVQPITPPTLDPVSVAMEDEIETPKGIFGSESEIANADRVVFVMDVSRSLTPAQLRLSKMELCSSVSALPASSRYQVIFFSGPTWFAHQRMTEGGARGEDVVIEDGGETHQWRSGFGGFEYEKGNDNLPNGEWRDATPENISATLADIEAVGKSYGTTWHLPLTMAMSLDPAPKDIYFLTDGETARQEQVAEDMVALAAARGNARVNTIALMVPGASVPLHKIAEGTGGDYSLVIAGGKVLKDQDLREYLSEKDISLND